MTTVFVDGDSIVYRSGFASDSKLYTVKSDALTVSAYHKRDALELCEDLGVSPDTITESKTHEPLVNCLHTVKLTLQKIVNETGARDIVVYLSGSTNFRNDIATIRKYKGNRDPNNKPYWYKEIRKYLVDTYQAIMSDNEEADDLLGIAGNKDGVMLAHLDKDILMIPGWHYNWDKNEITMVKPLDGIRHFYTQLITGDTADTIEGLAERKPKKRSYKTKPLETMTTEKEMYDYVFEGYALKYCDDAAEMLLENGRLLWIRQKENEIWKPIN